MSLGTLLQTWWAQWSSGEWWMLFILPLASGQWSGLKTVWMNIWAQSHIQPEDSHYWWPGGWYWGHNCLTSLLMNLVDCAAVSAHLQMVWNWEEWLMHQSCAAIQGDLDRLEKCDRILMMSNQGIWQVLALGRSSPMHCYRLGLTPERPLGSWWTPGWP